MRAEPHLVVVHREVRHAPAEFEELLARVAVALVLLHGVLDRLFGEAVLQLERGDRQAVDEKAQVERELRLVPAVAELAGDTEAVGGVAILSFRVVRRGRSVEEIQVVRPVFDAVAENVDRAPPADLALKTRKELAPRWAVFSQAERLGHPRLRVTQERRKLDQVHAVLSVVVARIPAGPAGTVGRRALSYLVLRCWVAGKPGQCCADQSFEAAFGGVGRHTSAFSGEHRGQRWSLRSSSWEISRSSSGSGASTSSGNRAAASRTSSFPVTTSAMRRVRYSRASMTS